MLVVSEQDLTDCIIVKKIRFMGSICWVNAVIVIKIIKFFI